MSAEQLAAMGVVMIVGTFFVAEIVNKILDYRLKIAQIKYGQTKFPRHFSDRVKETIKDEFGGDIDVTTHG
jgi:hypothetical protein